MDEAADSVAPSRAAHAALGCVLLFPIAGLVGAVVGFGAAVGRAVFSYMGG